MNSHETFDRVGRLLAERRADIEAANTRVMGRIRRHNALLQPTRRIGCGRAEEGWTPGGRIYKRECGKSIGGYEFLCDPCEDKANARYPHGWRYYPGDTCPHGTYVGGSGIDWICGYCEGGE